MATTLLSRGDVEAHTDFDRVLEVVEKTYIETAQEKVLNPPKLSMRMGDNGSWPDMNAFSIDMPAYVDWLEVAGMKWAVATWDADTDLPISSLILLFDLNEGRFKSVMEGMYLTGVRTAMQSVVGLRHLPSKPADTVGMFGAGFQARFQLSVIDALMDVNEFRIYDEVLEAARELAAEQAPVTDAEIAVADSPEEVAGSDALITVTDSKTPVLEESSLTGSEFIVALGSYRELPDATILDADRIVVDHVDQCLERGALADLAGRNEFTRDDVDATIGEVLRDGRQELVGPDERGIFVPIGMGALDIAIAEDIYTSSRKGDSLRQFDFESQDH